MIKISKGKKLHYCDKCGKPLKEKTKGMLLANKLKGKIKQLCDHCGGKFKQGTGAAVIIPPKKAGHNEPKVDN